MRIKQTLFTLLLLFVFSFSFGQYRSSIGGIFGKEGYGLSYKQFIQPEQNIEVNFLYRKPGGGQVVALFQFFKEINNATLHTRNLSWSFGLGVHAGYWQENPLGYKTGGNKSIGVDGVLGLEYYFGVIPFTLGAQLRPYWEYRTNTINEPQDYLDISIMIRYIIAD